MIKFDKKYINITNEGIISTLAYSANKIVEIKVTHFSLETILKVKVDYENIVKLSSLSISIPNNSIYVKQSVSPTIGINPSNATFNSYTLISSDTSIAQISKNKVVGVKAGRVEITCQSTVYEEIFEKVEIEVLPQPEISSFNVTTKSIFVNDEQL